MVRESDAPADARVPDILEALQANLVVSEDQHAMPINVSSLSAKEMPLVAFFDRARVLWGETRIYYFAAPLITIPLLLCPCRTIT